MRFDLTLHTRRGDHTHSLLLHSGLKHGKRHRLLREESLKLLDHETRGHHERGLLLEFLNGSTLRLHDHDCTFLLRLTRRS